MQGQFQVYTGDGKGKTTAAMGLTLRASGAGLRVLFAQFLKSGDYHEIPVLRSLPGVTVRQFGSGEFVLGQPSERERTLAAAGYAELAAAVSSGQWELVVADEINVACALGLLTEEQLLALADMRNAGTELVFTGRGAGESVCAKADLITEMRVIRHYYDEKQLPARPGIEF